MLLGLQLVGMLVFTTAQYQRFNLTNDFATYFQPWVAIAHGHLSPYDTILREPFWRNDFELVLWPMSLFYWLDPHAVTLLWLQVMAVVGGELVALSWAYQALARSDDRGNRGWLLGLVTVLLVTTPWSWVTIGFDLHLEVFASVFALLAARELWAGRYKRLWLWVPLTVGCCAVAGSLYVLAVGLAGLTGRNVSRRAAGGVVVAGAMWLVMVAALGGMGFGGHPLSAMYGYLSGYRGGPFGVVNIIEGVVEHPVAALDMFRSHAGFVGGYVASGGIIGLRSRWGLIPAAFVILPNALNANELFIRFQAAFQSWAAVLFLVVATCLVLQKYSHQVRRQWPGLVLGGVTAATAMAVSYLVLPTVPLYITRVSPRTAEVLAAVQRRAPREAEVIASQGIIGRFAAGRSAYPYWAAGVPGVFPVAGVGKPVIFIFSPHQGTGEGVPSETFQAIDYVRGTLRARVLERGEGIWAFVWTPTVPVRSIRLP